MVWRGICRTTEEPHVDVEDGVVVGGRTQSSGAAWAGVFGDEVGVRPRGPARVRVDRLDDRLVDVDVHYLMTEIGEARRYRRSHVHFR